MTSHRIRVLIIDEAVLSRDALNRALDDAKDIEVVGIAPNAHTGLARTRQLHPDLILVRAPISDVSPEHFVAEATRDDPDLGLLLVAAPTCAEDDLDGVVRLLEAGAFDCILEPELPPTDSQFVAALRLRLLPKIRAFSAARYSRVARGLSQNPDKKASANAAARRLQRRRSADRWDLLAIAISTGGPEALRELLPALQAFPIPIAIVIHLPGAFTGSLARTLDKISSLHVAEATDGALLQAGEARISAGGHHLLIDRNAGGKLITRTSNAPPENGFRPSADVLFRSGAAIRSKVLALIMTGMGKDGVQGLEVLNAAGSSYVIAQDEPSSVVWGMPGAAVRAGVTDEVLPLAGIAERLRELVKT